MERLTTNKNISDMNMYELAHNCCYLKDGNTRYRDFEMDMDARDLVRKLMVQYGYWKSCEEYGLDADNELVNDDIFDDTMLENLMYGIDDNIGLISLFYRNLCAMAGLRERLKAYENAEEQEQLLRVPCKVGDTVYSYSEYFGVLGYVIQDIRISTRIEFNAIASKHDECLDEINFMVDEIGKSVFLTMKEAEQDLKIESKGPDVLSIKVIEGEYAGNEYEGYVCYYDYLHTGDSPDLYMIKTPDGNKTVTSLQIDVTHYKAQLLARETERLGANVGDIVKIVCSGSGEYHEGWDEKIPHQITNITLSGYVEFDYGLAEIFRPDVEVIENKELNINAEAESEE